MRLLLLLLTLPFLPGAAFAQQPFYRDIPLTERGAPVRVSDMVFDEQGALWLGTGQGLYRYNGRAFTPEPPASTRRPVASLAYRAGALFVGFEDGNVLVLRSNKARRVFSAASRITCLLPVSFGLLVGTAGDGIALVRGEGTYRLTTANGLSDDYVNSISFAATFGRLLIATDRGTTTVAWTAPSDTLVVTRSREKGWALSWREALSDITRVVRPMTETKGEAVFWAGTEEHNIHVLSFSFGGEFSMERIFGGFPFEPSWGAVNDILPVSKFQAWYATDKGYVVRAELDTPHNHTLQRAVIHLPGKRVLRILRSPAGNLYLATTDGLTAVTAEYLQHLDAGPAYNLRALSTLATDHAGTVWYAQDKALYTRDTAAGTTLRYTTPETITSLYADAHSRLWIGTLGGGLLCMDDGRVQAIANVENLRGGHILHIAGRGDTLWVSSLNGVEELYAPPMQTRIPRVLRHHGRASGAGSDYIYSLYSDRRSRLWMATDGAGIAMWDGTRYHRWDSSTGFAPRVVYSIVEDNSGRIWAGTLEGGLYCWDGKAWKRYGREHGLQNNTILSLAALRDGSVVAVSEGGADQWLPESGEFRQYSRRMGLHIDSFSTVLNAVTMDAAGNALVPYEHGFLVVKPAALPPDFQPRIALRAVELFFKPIDTVRHRFAPDENGIGFRWEGIHFAAPERLRYRYRLRGYGQGWIETGDESVTFPRLPPGRYTFEAEAALGGDLASSGPSGFSRAARVSYAFQIASPLWKRWWFWGAVAVVLAGIGYALLSRRDQARQRLAMLQQARLRAEYEGLKSQVNPHFLFNSLNTLVSLIEEDPAAAARYTEQLSDLYRSTLAFRSRDVVTLGEEWAVLQKYLYIQQSRFGEALRVEADFAGDVLRDGKVIPLALQLLVENAIKHNEVSRAHPLTIHIATTSETITVRNALRPKASSPKGTGTGLENIRNRYALLTSRPILAASSGGQFIVTMPLL